MSEIDLQALGEFGLAAVGANPLDESSAGALGNEHRQALEALNLAADRLLAIDQDRPELGIRPALEAAQAALETNHDYSAFVAELQRLIVLANS